MVRLFIWLKKSISTFFSAWILLMVLVVPRMTLAQTCPTGVCPTGQNADYYRAGRITRPLPDDPGELVAPPRAAADVPGDSYDLPDPPVLPTEEKSEKKGESDESIKRGLRELGNRIDSIKIPDIGNLQTEAKKAAETVAEGASKTVAEKIAALAESIPSVEAITDRVRERFDRLDEGQSKIGERIDQLEGRVDGLETPNTLSKEAGNIKFWVWILYVIIASGLGGWILWLILKVFSRIRTVYKVGKKAIVEAVKQESDKKESGNAEK